MIERLRVRIPAEAAGEFSSPELTLCADSYSVSVLPACYRSGTKKTPVILFSKKSETELTASVLREKKNPKHTRD